MLGNMGEKGNKTLSAVCEINCDSITARRKIKGAFLERDKFQMSSYIKDLEKTLAINKEIISELLTGAKQEGQSRKIIMSLNQENARLQTQLKTVVKQRDSYQARLLITEQIIEEYKGKEGSCENQAHEKAQELLDQLNRKEYVVQSYERKFHRLFPILKKYSEKDDELRKLLKELNLNVHEERRITNLVEENAVLVTEVKTARQKMAELEFKVTELSKVNDTPAPSDLRSQEPERRLVQKAVGSPVRFSGATVRVQAQQAELTNKSLQNQIRQMQEENELVKDALRALQKKNEELSIELQTAKEELQHVRGMRRGNDLNVSAPVVVNLRRPPAAANAKKPAAEGTDRSKTTGRYRQSKCGCEVSTRVREGRGAGGQLLRGRVEHKGRGDRRLLGKRRVGLSLVVICYYYSLNNYDIVCSVAGSRVLPLLHAAQ